MSVLGIVDALRSGSENIDVLRVETGREIIWNLTAN